MIKWDIVSMASTPDAGVVVSVNWKCTSEEGEYTTSISGTAILPSPEDSFTPYNELTKSQVLNWVWINGGVDKDIVESSVNNALTEKMNPRVVIQALPF